MMTGRHRSEQLLHLMDLLFCKLASLGEFEESCFWWMSLSKWNNDAPGCLKYKNILIFTSKSLQHLPFIIITSLDFSEDVCDFLSLCSTKSKQKSGVTAPRLNTKSHVMRLVWPVCQAYLESWYFPLWSWVNSLLHCPQGPTCPLLPVLFWSDNTDMRTTGCKELVNFGRHFLGFWFNFCAKKLIRKIELKMFYRWISRCDLGWIFKNKYWLGKVAFKKPIFSAWKVVESAAEKFLGVTFCQQRFLSSSL